MFLASSFDETVARASRSTAGRCLALANLTREQASFIFERADAEVRASGAVGEILFDEGFESAAAFALRDVDESMHEHLAVLPEIRPDNDGGWKLYSRVKFSRDAFALTAGIVLN